jgi:4-alpha-glucanotransferase
VTDLPAVPAATLDRRRAGVLLHATSLPGAGTAGALGDAARHFVDWLRVGGFSVWQLLPLGPVGSDGSPYFARSNHAGNPALIDLPTLVAEGLLPAAAVPPPDDAQGPAAHRAALAAATAALLAARGEPAERFRAWCEHAHGWLDDYALFTAIQTAEHDRPWWEWSAELRRRQPAALAAARRTLAPALERVAGEQYLFHAQWAAVKRYANERGVRLFGDVPIYVAPDSVEAWAHPELFELGDDGRPTAVAGVPPDYFAADGQRWGNPLYRWVEHERTGFAWWLERLRAQLALYDLVRIDHFRGLEAYWSVPAEAETAREGQWIAAPGGALLGAVEASLGGLPLVAEDLGLITPAVEQLRDAWALPGMRVLQFGFDGSPGNLHALHAWVPNSVGYTGTHDNDTSAGWFASLDATTRARVCRYLDVAPERAVEGLVTGVLRSVARLAVVPLQDLLGLGSQARMNTPGTTAGNWGWRFAWGDVPSALGDRCRAWNELFERAGP